MSVNVNKASTKYPLPRNKNKKEERVVREFFILVRKKSTHKWRSTAKFPSVGWANVKRKKQEAEKIYGEGNVVIVEILDHYRP